ncbi:MAG: PocR ligand-binding domain-containing protein [Desulfuromusa sp.]|nr:PocR ligand-binding domain-containing protein [Desulfuromusa sp.]
MDAELVNLRNLIDIDELEYLFSDLSDITNFTIGLVDVVTNKFLLRVGWREICTEFHRAYPESEAYCKESNKRLTAGLKQVGDVRIDHCQNGLVDACTPIVVQGEHLAYLFTGQVLFSPPDLERFKSQALKFGYDEQHYLRSLAEVPIVDEKQISSILRYLAKKMMFIAQKKLDFLRSNSECLKHKDLFQHIADLAPVGIGIAHNRTIQWANRAMSQLTGYSNDELTGMSGETLYPSAEAFALSGEKIKNQFRSEGSAGREAQWKTKDGSLIDVYVNSAPLNNVPSGKTIFTALDITERKYSQRVLLESQRELKKTQLQLAETNTALKIVIKHVEQEKLELEEAIAANVLSLPTSAHIPHKALDIRVPWKIRALHFIRIFQ